MKPPEFEVVARWARRFNYATGAMSVAWVALWWATSLKVWAGATFSPVGALLLSFAWLPLQGTSMAVNALLMGWANKRWSIAALEHHETLERLISENTRYGRELADNVAKKRAQEGVRTH